jgi:hypothetical protein
LQKKDAENFFDGSFFLEASQIISNVSFWGERDKAIAVGLEKCNHATASKVATDSQTRFGCR